MENFPRPEQHHTPETQAHELMQQFHNEGGMEYAKKFVSNSEHIGESDIQGVAFGIMQWFRDHNLLVKSSPRELEQALKDLAKQAAPAIIREVRATNSQPKKSDAADPPLPKPRKDSSSISEVPEIQRGSYENPASHYVDPSERD